MCQPNSEFSCKNSSVTSVIASGRVCRQKSSEGGSDLRSQDQCGGGHVLTEAGSNEQSLRQMFGRHHGTRTESVDNNGSDESQEDEIMCWICHDDSNTQDMPLERTCSCPWMKVHRACLSRWQLQQAGKPEETKCRFCKTSLPDWREAHVGLPKAQPVMTVVHQNVVHQVVVKPGENGQRKFQEDIRRIFGLQEDDTIQLTFGCKVPGSVHEVTLEGWESYDAAVHCASLSAGQREKRMHTPSPNKRVVTRRGSSGGTGVLRRLFSGSRKASTEGNVS